MCHPKAHCKHPYTKETTKKGAIYQRYMGTKTWIVTIIVEAYASAKAFVMVPSSSQFIRNGQLFSRFLGYAITCPLTSILKAGVPFLSYSYMPVYRRTSLQRRKAPNGHQSNANGGACGSHECPDRPPVRWEARYRRMCFGKTARLWTGLSPEYIYSSIVKLSGRLILGARF